MNKEINYNYKLPPFKWFCLTNFPFIEADFDALTYYELLCKVVQYLNEVIVKTNAIGEQTEELTNAFNTLKDYVDNYFENLDVQEEINNKLDKMVLDGTLKNIINNELLSTLNEEIANNSSKIQNLEENTINKNDAGFITEDMLSQEVKEMMTGGSVAVVGDNTILASNIVNGAIDILNLKENLQTNFIKNFEDVDLGANFVGFPQITTDNEITINTSVTNINYYIVDLVKDEIYDYNGYNAYSMKGLIVVDTSDGKVVYTTGRGNLQSFEAAHLTFRANKTGLRAYYTTYVTASNSDIIFLRDNTTFTKIKDVSLNTKYNFDIEVTDTQNGKFITTDTTTLNNIPKYDSSESASTTIYKIRKNVEYIISSFYLYKIAGIVILNNDFQVTYMSNAINYQGVKDVNLTYKATADGYICLPNYESATVKKRSTIYINQPNILLNKSIYFEGDSVAVGYGNNNISYCDYIKDKNNMTMYKQCVNGATLSNSNNSILNRVKNNINNAYKYDYVIIEGGLNDIFQNVPIGTISEGYNAELDENTFIGALESLCKTLVTYYSNCKFAYILTNKKVNEFATAQNNFWNKAIEVFEKWSIPYIDISKESGCLPITNELLNKYFYIPSGASVGDGTHPNSLGYERFYNNIIETRIKLL